MPIDEEGRRLTLVNMPTIGPPSYRLFRELVILVLLSVPPALHGLDLGEFYDVSPPLIKNSPGRA